MKVDGIFLSPPLRRESTAFEDQTLVPGGLRPDEYQTPSERVANYNLP